MERVAWTDERLDDLSQRMDAGFDRIDRDLRDLRTEFRTELRAEAGSLRAETGALGAELRAEIGALRAAMIRVGGGIVVGLVGVIAAVFANGA